MKSGLKISRAHKSSSHREKERKNTNRSDRARKIIDKELDDSRVTSPLSGHLLTAKYPDKWVRPKLPEYKGTSDPETHVVKFIANMEDITDRQDLWCRLFVRILEGEAMNWYVDLPSNNIHWFRDLKEYFVEAFGHRIKRRIDIGMLLTIIQGPIESLRRYITRFNETLIKIAKPTDGAAIIVLRAGLRPTRFLEKITDDPPRSTLAEMLERAYRQMNTEETMDQRIKEVVSWGTQRPVRPNNQRGMINSGISTQLPNQREI